MALAALLQRRLDREDAAQLAMRARLGAHRDRGHAGQRDQPVRQLVNDLQRALHRIDGRERVNVAEPWQAGHLLVQARIVLHRARAEREQAQVDRVILTRQTGIVTHRLRLRQARQADRVLAAQVAQTRTRDIALGEIDAGGVRVADLEDQLFFEHQRAVAGEGRCDLAVLGFGARGLPAALVDRHASTSSSAWASVSISSAVTVSVTATTSPFASASSPG